MPEVHGRMGAVTRRAALAALGAGGLALAGRRVQAQVTKPAEIKVGIATYLSGPASVFGVPGKHAAELLFDEINAAGGIGGVRLRPIFFDEGPGVDHFVAEYRRIVQSERVDIMFAAISSADCLACVPIAEELKRPTLLWDCSTQRIFEEGRYEYVFRTIGNSTPEVLAPLLYLIRYKPNFSTIAVVNQDYVWGRDSWAMTKSVLERLKPGVRIVAEMFPRFGATDYSTEITRLLATKPDVVFNGSWGGDLDTFIRQGAERKLLDRTLLVLPLGESSLERVGNNLPAGHIIGARGDHWFLHPSPEDPKRLAAFTESYRKRTGMYPIYPCFHMAQAVSAMKSAYVKALAAKSGAWPTDAELAAAFKGLQFSSLTSPVRIREDGQGLANMLVGATAMSSRYPFPILTDMAVFPGELVTTPVGKMSFDWLKTLEPSILEKVPATVAFKG